MARDAPGSAMTTKMGEPWASVTQVSSVAGTGTEAPRAGRVTGSVAGAATGAAPGLDRAGGGASPLTLLGFTNDLGMDSSHQVDVWLEG